MDIEKYERFILRNSDYFIAMYSLRMVIPIEKLRKYKEILNWYYVGSNNFIQWNEEKFEEFNTYLIEYSNEFFIDDYLTWSFELLNKYKSRLNWANLIQNDKIIQNLEICKTFKPELSKALESICPCFMSDEEKDLILNFSSEKFADYVLKKKRFCYVNTFENLFTKETDIESIKHINWKKLSLNDNLPWSLEFIEKYKDKLDWETMSLKECLPWSPDFIEKYALRWDWHYLSNNSAITWDNFLIDKYKDKIDWTELSKNTGIDFTIDFFHKYKNRFLKKGDYTVEITNSSQNDFDKDVIINDEIIYSYNKFYDYRDFSNLVKWDIETLRDYENKINWIQFSFNLNMNWTIDILNEFNNQISIGDIYYNYKLWEDVFSVLTESQFDYFLDKIIESRIEEQ